MKPNKLDIFSGVMGFLTSSRIRLCKNTNCKNNRSYLGELLCNIRELEIDDEGKCMHINRKKENKL